MRPFRDHTGLFAPACLLVLAGIAHADQAVPAALTLPTADGPRLYLLDNPNAATSPGHPANRPDRAGPLADTVSARVIIELRDPAAAPPADAALIEHVPGFAILAAPSIREAADLASELALDPAIARAYVDIRSPRAQRTPPADPLYPNQWHLSNALTPSASINAPGAWDLGYTGAGLTVGVVDFGASTSHPDLAPNLNAAASQPIPATQRDGHSTSCAGLIAAARNTIGGVGVAYDARWANLTFGFSIADEAAAFAFRNDLTAVKSNSWGPLDNGQVSSLDPLNRAALQNAAATGRSGLGTVFIWAGGNGGAIDRVDYDPYASSRHVIAINPVGDLNQPPAYAEAGSCLIAAAPSDGNTRAITTTDFNGVSNTYTAFFGGSSAAAPTAAGVAALVLQANPALTARDVAHVLIGSAQVINPADPGWQNNGAARPYHERLGFGLIDAARAVTIARGYVGVGPVVHLASGLVTVNTPVPDGSPVGLTRTALIAEPMRVEHVELTLTVATPFVGDLRVTLTSPAGTVSTLAVPRFDPAPGYSGHVFTITRAWDEDAAGLWTVTVTDETPGNAATWTSFAIDVYGNRRCVADVTGIGGPPFPPDGQLTIDDIIAFVNAFSAGEPFADVARIGPAIGPDAQLTVDDIILFINAYSDGCP
jgi:subtilisin-like proprotein convertase family protein